MAPDTAGVSIAQCSQSLPQALLLIPNPKYLLVLFGWFTPNQAPPQSGASLPVPGYRKGGEGWGALWGVVWGQQEAIWGWWLWRGCSWFWALAVEGSCVWRGLSRILGPQAHLGECGVMVGCESLWGCYRPPFWGSCLLLWCFRHVWGYPRILGGTTIALGASRALWGDSVVLRCPFIRVPLLGGLWDFLVLLPIRALLLLEPLY